MTDADDQPPVFKTWRQVYIFVLAMHVLVITLLYFFMKHFS